MIVESEAIVLKASRYSETSKILTVYTRELGKIGLIARGAMQPKSKFAGVLQPLAYLGMVIYVKEGRGLQNLGSAETVRRFPTIAKDLDRTVVGLEIVELVSAAMHDQERNDSLFNLLLQALQALNESHSDARIVLLQFITAFCAILGFAIRVNSCGICGEEVAMKEEGIPFSISAGAPLCSEHLSAATFQVLSASTFNHLTKFVADGTDFSADVEISNIEIADLQDLLIRFLKFHVEGLRTLRVGGISSTMRSK
ncbi:MAG: DNA repair protein RecO [Ignavibacteriae bacterium]|nr:DNA repair protein RecO [Ignavibacteriota bacterium]MCB9217226.1 DNA repair protein RecO [Ignavibacteria bacterium]